MVFWIKIVLFFIPDDPSSQLLRFIRFWAPFFQKIVDDQLKYHSKTIEEKRNEEKATKKKLLILTLAKHAGMGFYLQGKSIDINTSGLPAPNIFAWILRYQLKITKADEYWWKMTNMRVIEHRWLLNNTKNTGQQSTSWANTLIFRPSLITLFKAELAVQMYICQWENHALRAGREITWIVLKNHRKKLNKKPCSKCYSFS